MCNIVRNLGVAATSPRKRIHNERHHFTQHLHPHRHLEVDPSHSTVGFAVKHMGIATVRGEFTEFEGALEIGQDLASAKARHGQGAVGQYE